MSLLGCGGVLCISNISFIFSYYSTIRGFLRIRSLHLFSCSLAKLVVWLDIDTLAELSASEDTSKAETRVSALKPVSKTLGEMHMACTLHTLQRYSQVSRV